MEVEKNIAIEKLKERGVTIRDISEIVVLLHKNYQDLTNEQCDQAVLNIINKREVIYTILTGIALDEMAEKELLDKKINDIIARDNPLFGLDEILALSIVNLNGSIALTNFGYIDKTKPGIVGKLDNLGKTSSKCHTFLDDIVAAIAASAISRIAHSAEK